MPAHAHRSRVARARRLVVKVGTRVLVDGRGRPRPERIQAIVDQIARLRADAREVVLVSSGAVGAGLDPLGFARRPRDLMGLQMAAAVGQTRLMGLYGARFGEKGISVGQVLLNHGDLKTRNRHLNARNALLGLLHRGVVPIVNENDVVSVDEIRLGDNDTLAALVSVLVDADLLVLCTSVNGLREPVGEPVDKPADGAGGRTRRVSCLARVDAAALALAGGKGSDLSTGGMATKLRAADTANRAGALSLIVDGRKPDTLLRACAGEDVGTLVGPIDPDRRVRGKRKHWIAFFHKPTGRVVVDDGARAALVRDGKSLLAAGVRAVEGRFDIGAVVEVTGPGGTVFATGLTEFASDDLIKIQGEKSPRILEILGPAVSTEVIHRDNLALHSSEGDPHAQTH